MDPDPLFRMNRIFDAPVSLVWGAHLWPGHLAVWFPPAGFHLTTIVHQATPGGSFVYELRRDEIPAMRGRWRFEEVEAPRRLVQCSGFLDEQGSLWRHPQAPRWPLETRSVLVFEPWGSRTRLHLTVAPVAASEAESRAFRDGFPCLAESFDSTWNQLERHLERIQA